ncbi:hypothetical protein BZG36_02845 [Bifiguratus adelaidae]|uniref:Uncharacterized protein n=1 Tax=Bifiguratus adelaidae TaxID=1938954 RepID=A0A261Y0N2_9FUNG|nr:hypothetical protein BZG36_02845 [Bifiguratus adelaidae]
MSLPRLPFEVTERIILLVQDLSLCLELGVGGQATLVKLVEAQYGPGRVLSEALRRKDYKLIQWLASHFRIPPEVALLKCAQSGDETSLQLTFSLYYPSSEPTVHALRVATQLAIRFGRIGVLDALLQRQQLHELMFYGYCRSCLFRPENILDWLMTRWDTIRNYPQLCERMVTCAIWGDRLDVLERLLDADAKFLLDPIDTYHFTGGLTGSEETFRWILRWAARRADSPEVASRSPVLFSAIGHACARLGYSALLKDLLSPPYNVSVYLGMIYSAIVWGNLDTVRTLYNHLVSQDLMQLRTERSTLTLENKFAVTTSFVRNLRSRKPVDEDGFAIIRYVLDKSAGIATAIRDDILKNMILTSSLSNCEEFV